MKKELSEKGITKQAPLGWGWLRVGGVACETVLVTVPLWAAPGKPPDREGRDGEKKCVLGDGWICVPTVGSHAGARREVWVPGGDALWGMNVPQLCSLPVGETCLSPIFNLVGDIWCLPAGWLPGNAVTVVGWLWLCPVSPVPDTRPHLPQSLLSGLWLRFTPSSKVLCWFWSSASAQEPAAAAWEGACRHSIVFSSSHAGAGLLWLPGHVPLCSLHGCICADVLRRALRSKSKKCQGQSREQLSWSKPPCFPFPSIPHFVLAPPVAASPSPCRVRAKCPRCHHAHVLDSGCRTPSRSPTKLFLLGTEQGWGGQAGMCPPEYQ